MLLALALLAAAPVFGPDKLPAVSDAADPLVDAALVVPGLIVDLTYAKPQNIAGRALYPKDMKCWLRRSAAERLALVQKRLRGKGLRLVAWDCTRSHDAQEALWKALPRPGSVADPKRGSLHERGVGVDLGLADLKGLPVPLPTKHDEFRAETHALAKLSDAAAARNRDALRSAMHAHGFRVNPKEWWHFSRLYGWRWPRATWPPER